jgi:hypothetical protein
VRTILSDINGEIEYIRLERALPVEGGLLISRHLGPARGIEELAEGTVRRKSKVSLEQEIVRRCG